MQAAQLLLGVDVGDPGPTPEPANKRLRTPSPQPGPKLAGPEGAVHQILDLGWKPLCRVRCNRLEGELLGGHDREVFVRCISAPFLRLPDVAMDQGGRIMTCSQFERVAGRELSKKWKESIHVMGYGEGARATLACWLKEQAAALFGDGVVGKAIRIRWLSDSRDHRAWVSGFSSESGRHTVIYEEGQSVEQLHLPLEKIQIVDGHTPSAGPAPPLFHQNSGVSDSSSDGGAVEKLRKPSFQSRPLLDARRILGPCQGLRSVAESPGEAAEGGTIPVYQPAAGEARAASGVEASPASEEERARWMHRLSIAVDQVCGDAPAVGPRFQATVAMLHGRPGLEGLYLALQTRLEGTGSLDPETRIAQLRELMLAAADLASGGGELRLAA